MEKMLINELWWISLKQFFITVPMLTVSLVPLLQVTCLIACMAAHII